MCSKLEEFGNAGSEGSWERANEPMQNVLLLVKGGERSCAAQWRRSKQSGHRWTGSLEYLFLSVQYNGREGNVYFGKDAVI